MAADTGRICKERRALVRVLLEKRNLQSRRDCAPQNPSDAGKYQPAGDLTGVGKLTASLPRLSCKNARKQKAVSH